MHRTTTLLASTQRGWPLLARLSLIVCSTPPSWVVATARRLSAHLNPTERARCLADYPQVIAQLSGLRRQWRGTLVLAALLAMAVIARAFEVPFDIPRMVIFAVTLYAILLPALIIQIGVTYDYMAAFALLQTLRSIEDPHVPEQRTSTDLMPAEAFQMTPTPGTSSKAEYAEQEVERLD